MTEKKIVLVIFATSDLQIFGTLGQLLKKKKLPSVAGRGVHKVFLGLESFYFLNMAACTGLEP